MPDVVIINDYMARHYWPGENPIGKRITFDDPQKNPSWATVVGVVKNTVRSNWVNPAEEEVFVPYLQSKQYLQNPSGPFAYLTLVVRTTGESSEFLIRSSGRDSFALIAMFPFLKFRPWIK